MQTLAQIFRALADETRLKMLTLVINRGELCVCDFVNVLGITQSKASRHLRYLLHAGLLVDRREGVWAYYRLPDGFNESDRKAVIDMIGKLVRKKDVLDLDRMLDKWLRDKQIRGLHLCQLENNVVETDN